MINFEYFNPARIIFGKDTIAETGKQAAKLGKRVLLHYGGGSIKKNGIYDIVAASLKAENLIVFEFGGVRPNPTVELVREGIELCRKNNIDCILAVGGGSVIDSAKAIAAGTLAQKDIWEYFINEEPVFSALPIGVVLTIPAAGSESSDSMVVSSGELKRFTGGDCIIPKFAVLDPQVCYSLPTYQTACGASDILAHLMERYFTNTPDVALTDRLLEGAMITVLEQAPIAIRKPDDYKARAELMWAGTLAHNNILGTGRIGDWASHSIEHELSAEFGVAHGAGLAVVFPSWIKHVYRENISRFTQFATRVFGINEKISDEETVLCAIESLKMWYKQIGLPLSISEISNKAKDLQKLAKRCLYLRDSVGNLKKLNEQDVYEILSCL